MCAINNSKVYLSLNVYSHTLLMPGGSALFLELKASLEAVCAQGAVGAVTQPGLFLGGVSLLPGLTARQECCQQCCHSCSPCQ